MMKRTAPILALSLLMASSNAFSPIVNPTTFASRSTRAAKQGSSTTSTSTSLQMLPLPTVDGSRLVTLFLEKCIDTLVPTIAACGVVGFAANAFSKKDKQDSDLLELQNDKNAVSQLYSDLYGEDNSSKNNNWFKKFGAGSFGTKSGKQNKNLGIPTQEYIDVTNLNSKFNNYQYSMTAATQSKAKAAAQARNENFDRALQLGMDSSLEDLTLNQKTQLMQLEQDFLKQGANLMSTLQLLQTKLTQSAIDEEMNKMGTSVMDIDPKPMVDAEIIGEETGYSNSSSIINTSKNKTNIAVVMDNKSEDKTKQMQLLAATQKALTQLELTFVSNVIAVLGPDRANGVRTALLGSARGTGFLLEQLQDRPLSALLGGNEETSPSLFVTNFPGDVSASQVADLREEVTAICRSAKPGDEALVVLQSGGGTVTGYGLAAAQLQRFKDAGLKLTICVEQVAASGGYMMCCVADKIVASPFAVLGSIGVITDIPNVYERLQKEGITFQTVTAGKFKRTLTPTKKVTREDFQKTKEDVEDILGLFKNFVKENRPSLDIDQVATGETWFGTDALNMGLCDEIKTVDQVLTEAVDDGYNVYKIKYSPPLENGAPDLAKLLPAGASSSESGGIVGRAIKWIVKTVASEIKSEFGGTIEQQPVERRYMMVDDTAEKIRAQD